MDINLKNAIIHFLANEFKLDPETIGPDLQFSDLGLTQPEVLDLLNRLQEALDFALPEDKLSGIQTIEDLLLLVDPDSETEE